MTVVQTVKMRLAKFLKPPLGKQTPALAVFDGGLVIGALALAQSMYPIGSAVFIVKTFIAGAAKAKLARNEVKIKSVFSFLISKKIKNGQSLSTKIKKVKRQLFEYFVNKFLIFINFSTLLLSSEEK